MSETQSFSALDQEQIREGARRTKLTQPNIAAALSRLRTGSPALATGLEVAKTQLFQLWPKDLAPDFDTGAAASHLLLQNLSVAHNIPFPREGPIAGDNADNLIANYGASEIIGEKNKDLQRLELPDSDTDLLSTITTVREFEAQHPLWFSAGVQMAARFLRWPANHFDSFLANGRLIDNDVRAPDDCDRFAMFAEGFADVGRFILGAEAKHAFEAQFNAE